MNDYRNDTPMKDRLDALFNDRNVLRRKDTSTFLSHTHTDEGGRFAKPQQITGSEPSVEYPRQPDNSFSNQSAAVGVEPPYDGDMSTPIVGEVGEVQASIERLERAAASASFHSPNADEPQRGAGAAPSDRSTLSASATPIPSPTLKRRSLR